MSVPATTGPNKATIITSACSNGIRLRNPTGDGGCRAGFTNQFINQYLLMNTFTQLFVAVGIVLALPNPVLTDFNRSISPVERAKPKATYAPVAVLELFTSQGCSSCPSADRLLTETLAEATKTNKQVIGLSFHVDYWDRLGWKDPFSNHAFTQRQYAYSEHFAQRGVYTPQEVLNGQQEFVGSNRSRQSSALKEALSTPATVGVQIAANTPKANQLTVSYQLEGDLTNAVLNVALVSKTTETIVQRGENSGRTLTHDNVVRVFRTVPATGKGTMSFTLPTGYEISNGAVVAYVQARQMLAVRGAGMLNL